MNFEGYDILNPSEQKFLSCLEAVTDETIWGIGIRKAMENPTAVKIRRLIADLKSQDNDAPEIMLDILGPSCYEQLKNL